MVLKKLNEERNWPKFYDKYTYSVGDKLTHVWQVWYEKNGFKYFILCQGTEQEVREYLESEMGYMGRYSGMTETEVDMTKKLGCKIYIAPEI